jgi:hypothetical protein
LSESLLTRSAAEKVSATTILSPVLRGLWVNVHTAYRVANGLPLVYRDRGRQRTGRAIFGGALVPAKRDQALCGRLGLKILVRRTLELLGASCGTKVICRTAMVDPEVCSCRINHHAANRVSNRS